MKNKYILTVNVGVFRHVQTFELGRAKWLWVAKLRAWLYLQEYPYREIIITRSDEE